MKILDKKLIIFDKDGTLTTPKSDNTFVQSPDDQKMLPGVAEALGVLIAANKMIAIASNQGGVAAGFKSIDEAWEEMEFALELCNIGRGVFCPDMEGETIHQSRINPLSNEAQRVQRGRSNAECEGLGSFRKPGPGMLNWLIACERVDLGKVLFIGDRPEDEQAAAAAKVDFLWADEWLLDFKGA